MQPGAIEEVEEEWPKRHLYSGALFCKKGAKLFLRVFDREKSRKKEAFCSFLRFNYAMRIPPKSRCKCFPDPLLPVLQHGFRCNIFPLPPPRLSRRLSGVSKVTSQHWGAAHSSSEGEKKQG